MIPWEVIRPGLLSLICDLGGLQTDYGNKQRSYTDPKQQARVLLLERAEDQIGIDDRRLINTLDPIPLSNLQFSQNGHRRVNLDIRVESFRHDDDRFAFNAISKIRTSLNFPSSRARLLALNIAIIRKGRAIDVPNILNDQRITSVAVLDLELNIGICAVDVDNPVSGIEVVNPPKGTFLPPC